MAAPEQEQVHPYDAPGPWSEEDWLDALINDAVDVGLVVEIVSPSNAAYDRILKPRLYAEAGIVRYLRVEHGPGGPVGHLHELVDGVYREVANGPTITLGDPFPATLDLAALAR